jgi:predicted peroxiredoxin
MKKILLASILFLSQISFSQESKDYFVLLTSDPMTNPSAAMMSINTASEALAQGHNVVFFAAGDGVKILMKDVISNLHTVSFHGGNTNNMSKRALKLITEFSNKGGVIHVSEGSFITYGVNQNNSKDILINIDNINWSYPKQLIQISSSADLVFSY